MRLAGWGFGKSEFQKSAIISLLIFTAILAWIILCTLTLLHLPPLGSTVPEDAGTEPRTVARLRLWQSDAPITRLDLIHLG